MPFELLPRHQRAVLRRFSPSKTIRVDREADDAVLAETLEVERRELRGVARSEDHDVGHAARRRRYSVSTGKYDGAWCRKNSRERSDGIGEKARGF